MLFTDGDYIIYVIQHVYKDKPNGPWDNSGDCAQFMPKGFTREQWEDITYKEPFRSLTACGKCWQETGIKGTYDLKKASIILAKVSEWAPEHKFRIAELKISQRTTQIAIEEKTK